MSVESEFLTLLDGFVVAEGHKPDDGGWQGGPGASPFHAYVMVTFGSADTDGSLAVADSQRERWVLTTCVAATPEGVRVLSDAVIAAVSGQRIDTDERVTTAPISVERIGSVDRDDTVQPPVWMAVHEFRVDTVPV